MWGCVNAPDEVTVARASVQEETKTAPKVVMAPEAAAAAVAGAQESESADDDDGAVEVCIALMKTLLSLVNTSVVDFQNIFTETLSVHTVLQTAICNTIAVCLE